MLWDRRRLSLTLAAGLPATWGRGAEAWPQAAAAPTATAITDIEGLLVGHRTLPDRPSGCTVVLAPAGARAGVAVRGAAPGSRELALLDPLSTVESVHGILLSGGSAFGLAAADGVVAELRERDIGLAFGNGVIPIVPGAILFDLTVSGGAAPGAEDGRLAAAAAAGARPASGSVGAGAGATVGKMFTGSAMKGGIGSGGVRFADGTVVAALVAVNCRGDVLDPATGALVAGALEADGRTLRNTQATLLRGEALTIGAPGQATTIGVVATNRRLDKAQCGRLASVAHDGLARAVVPAHSRWDGDTLFALATGALPAPATDGEHDALEAAAAAAVTAAILDAVRSATGLPGYPAARDIGTA